MSDRIAYVIFNKETGSISSITNEILETENFIQVPLDDVLHLKNGQESLTSYHVQYNPKTKEFELQSKNEFALDAVTVKDFIYEIPENNIDDADVQIIQDIPNTCWKVMLGNSLKENIKKKGINLNVNFLFSITDKGDPNVLYKTLSVHIGKTLSDNYCIVPFDMPFELTDSSISIYTSRRFDTYQFKRIFDE